MLNQAGKALRLFADMGVCSGGWACLLLCSQVYATVIMAADDFRAFFWVNLAGHLSLALFAWLLIPRWGLAGAAVTFLVSRAILFTLIQSALARRHGLTMTRGVVGLLVYALAAVVLSALVFRNIEASTVTVGIRLGVLAMFAGGTLFFLTTQERTWLAARIRLGRGVRAS